MVKKRIKTNVVSLDISRTVKKLILLFVIARLPITNMYAMEGRTPDGPKPPQQLNDLNCFVMRLAQEYNELRRSVEAALTPSRDCAVDLHNIIFYLHELAKDYRPESPVACRTLLSAQAVLDRLDTCINQHSAKPHMINPGIPILMPADQRRHFIQQVVSESDFAIFNHALVRLNIAYPR